MQSPGAKEPNLILHHPRRVKYRIYSLNNVELRTGSDLMETLKRNPPPMICRGPATITARVSDGASSLPFPGNGPGKKVDITSNIAPRD